MIDANDLLGRTLGLNENEIARVKELNEEIKGETFPPVPGSRHEQVLGEIGRIVWGAMGRRKEKRDVQESTG